MLTKQNTFLELAELLDEVVHYGKVLLQHREIQSDTQERVSLQTRICCCCGHSYSKDRQKMLNFGI
jgi:hypothetical protein